MKTISQHSLNTGCDARVCWTAEGSPRLRARSKRCADLRSPAIRVNKRLCSPRALHLPHLYQGAHTSTPPNVETARSTPGAVVAGDPPCVLSPAEKVEHLFRIFDVDQDALLCYSELRAFLSALAEKEWDDHNRYEEWCSLLKADASRGLTLVDFGTLLSLERSFLDDSFRILGVEALGVRVLNPAAVLRTDLLRRALDINLAVVHLLTSCWSGEFLRLLASELLSAIPMSGGAYSAPTSTRGTSPAHMVKSAAEAHEVLAMLLRATHDFVEAAASAAERWYNCFQGYLRRAALDRSVQEWAAFDATWGAKIASLMAQVRGVEALRREILDSPAHKPDLIWRYVRMVLELMPALESSKPHGLVMPTTQIAALESAARHILFSGSQPAQRTVEAGGQQPRTPPRSPCLSSAQRPARHNRRIPPPTRGWAGHPAKSAPATPVDRPLRPIAAATPVDRSVKSVPATPVQQLPLRQDKQHKVQPPTKLPVRSGKRPFPSKKEPTTTSATEDDQVLAAMEVQADVSAEEVDALSLEDAGDAALLNQEPCADVASDDALYDSGEDEAEADALEAMEREYDNDVDQAAQDRLSPDNSSDELPQASSSSILNATGDSLCAGESRDVVEPLQNQPIAHVESLRSATPASTATYEMDFDSEDGNVAADVRSDENADAEHRSAGSDSIGSSAGMSEIDPVTDPSVLTESVAADVRPLVKDSPPFSDAPDDEEEDFFENARRAAHMEASVAAPELQEPSVNDGQREEDDIADKTEPEEPLAARELQDDHIADSIELDEPLPAPELQDDHIADGIESDGPLPVPELQEPSLIDGQTEDDRMVDNTEVVAQRMGGGREPEPEGLLQAHPLRAASPLDAANDTKSMIEEGAVEAGSNLAASDDVLAMASGSAPQSEDTDRSSTSSDSEDLECVTTTIPPRQVDEEPSSPSCYGSSVWELDIDAELQVGDHALLLNGEHAHGESVWELDIDNELHTFDPSLGDGAEQNAQRQEFESAHGDSVWELDIDHGLHTFDHSWGFLHDCGVDGSLPRFGMEYQASEATSVQPSGRGSVASVRSIVAETISLPPESIASAAESGTSSESTDPFKPALL